VESSWVHSALLPLIGLLCQPGWLWWWRKNWWHDDWQGKPKYSQKTCLSAALSATNPTWPDRARTWAAAVGSQRLTVWATARFSVWRWINIIRAFFERKKGDNFDYYGSWGATHFLKIEYSHSSSTDLWWMNSRIRRPTFRRWLEACTHRRVCTHRAWLTNDVAEATFHIATCISDYRRGSEW
jgi:hypothetical protein